MRFVLRKSLGYIEKYDKFLYLFCPNTGTKFREPYHSNHMIPHREYYVHGATALCMLYGS